MSTKKKIKVGCGWWGFRELPIEEHFKIAHQFGFKTLEFGIGDELEATIPTGIDNNGIEQIKNLCKKYNVRIPFATLENDFTLPSKKDNKKMISKVLEKIDVLEQFDVSHIRIFAGFTPASELTEDTYQQVINSFQQCAAKCQSHNMQISIETHGNIKHSDGISYHTDTITTNKVFLKRLVQDLPHGVGFNYDPGNIKAIRPDDLEYCLPLINHRINYCHLKDWKKVKDGWVAAAIGDDDLNYEELLPKINFTGTYLIEYEPIEDLENGIQRSLDYLKEIGYELNFA